VWTVRASSADAVAAMTREPSWPGAGQATGRGDGAAEGI